MQLGMNDGNYAVDLALHPPDNCYAGLLLQWKSEVESIASGMQKLPERSAVDMQQSQSTTNQNCCTVSSVRASTRAASSARKRASPFKMPFLPRETVPALCLVLL